MREISARALLRTRAIAARIRAPLLRRLLRQISYVLVPSGTRVWTRVQAGPGEGLLVSVNPRTGHLYRDAEIEPVTQAVLSAHLRPGDVFYDLGANVGFFTMLGARLVGERGQVYAFEPEPDVAARLRGNVAHNGFHNVTVVEACVWSETGELRFSRADPDVTADLGLGHVAGNADTERAIPVRACRLDDFVQSAAPPTFIKCDVEGAEVEVLEGAARLLARLHPALFVETHSSSNHARVIERLRAFGYHTVREVDGSHVIALPGAGGSASTGIE